MNSVFSRATAPLAGLRGDVEIGVETQSDGTRPLVPLAAKRVSGHRVKIARTGSPPTIRASALGEYAAIEYAELAVNRLYIRYRVVAQRSYAQVLW